MMLSTMIATTSPPPTTTTDIREDINNVLKEWHFGTEDMFDNEDLESMADDIMKIINKNINYHQNNNQEINS